jgi:VanZ family protein
MVKKNFFSIVVAVIITYLSLTSPGTFRKIHLINIPNMDKIVHFCMYFGLMCVIIFENRRSFKNKGILFMIALIPLSYGILMEILQGTLTSTRSADIHDVFANACGIATSLLLWLLIKPYFKENIR